MSRFILVLLCAYARALQLDLAGGDRRCLKQAISVGAGSAFLVRGVPKYGELPGESALVKVEVRDPARRLIAQRELRFELEPHDDSDREKRALKLPPDVSGLFEICFVSLTANGGPRRVELLERMSKPILIADDDDDGAAAAGRKAGKEKAQAAAAAAAVAADGKAKAGAADKEEEDEYFGGPSAMLDDDDEMPLEWLMRQAENTALTLSVGFDYELEREAALKAEADRTHSRTRVFAWLSVAILLGASTWQLFYLKRFFRSKKLL